MRPALLTATWLVARKDLKIEFRTRTAFLAVLVFAILGVAIFYFAWDSTAVAAIDLAPGVLWVIFTFSGLLSLQRSFGAEQSERALDGLLLSPIDREAIFLGKALANFLFVAGIQLVTIPAVALLYNLPLGHTIVILLAIALLAAVGLVAVGTLFSAMAANTRLAELLLPMLSLPFFVPVVYGAAQSTSILLAGRPIAEAWPFLKLLIAFDLVFLFACTLAFPFTLEE
ncbi:MAG TPA: heme exporter protein CcmB [Gemmatimonadaceae bacterium]|nr:heme exporter protein CcmB [Gemmatimonadaceae bacterium]